MIRRKIQDDFLIEDEQNIFEDDNEWIEEDEIDNEELYDVEYNEKFDEIENYEEDIIEDVDDEWKDIGNIEEFEDEVVEDKNFIEDEDYELLTDEISDEDIKRIQKAHLSGDIRTSDLESYLYNNYFGDAPIIIKITTKDGQEKTATINEVLFSNNTLILKGSEITERQVQML